MNVSAVSHNFFTSSFQVLSSSCHHTCEVLSGDGHTPDIEINTFEYVNIKAIQNNILK